MELGRPLFHSFDDATNPGPLLLRRVAQPRVLVERVDDAVRA